MSPHPTRTSVRIAVLGVLLVSLVALAAASPVLISVFMNGTTVTVTTNSMPKGWFANGNTFDRTKSYLRTDFSLGATSCSAAQDGGSLNSLDAGTFTPVLNGGGSNVNGYIWDGGVDLAAFQNHWANYLRCSGAVEISGCDDAIPVTVTTTAFARSGACHTFVNDAGYTVCASDTRTASLQAVQGADLIEVCPLVEESCGIGQCESACVQDCSLSTDQEERRICHQRCVCRCMIEVRTGTSCEIPAKCLDQ